MSEFQHLHIESPLDGKGNVKPGWAEVVKDSPVQVPGIGETVVGAPFTRFFKRIQVISPDSQIHQDSV